ncbi:MAG TPA: MMPL family transporter, partial [Saprospiraceae bacterium]|nr:MMPL family transporter [Saprospiraceae bacterium]
MWLKFRKGFLITLGIIFLASIALLPQLKFEFDFEQFFPEGDEDLAFYKDFIQDFETDNNFLLVGVENESGVFEQSFLAKLQKSTTDLRDIPQVRNSQSITSIRLPFKTPFGFTSFPLVHVSEPDRYASDREKILKDKRFVGNLINERGTAAVILLKTIDTLPVTESDLFIDKVDSTMSANGLSDYHLLGRGFFQSEIVKIQKTEILICGIISFLAVMIIMWLIYRKVSIIFITLTSVTVSLIVFFGFLSITNRGLSLMSALYPVIILIAGTSDIIHILNKYLFELRHGKSRILAISNSMKEVGLSTFITSATTAVGFLALMTSRLKPVREFGFNCAIGVMITFIIAVPLTMALLSYFDEHKISQDKRSTKFWDNFIEKLHLFTKNHTKGIVWATIGITVFCIIGITKISTNYSIQKNLPLYAKVGIDFLFFEKQFSGFRPLEFAVLPQGDYQAGDYEVVKAINDLESHLESYGVIGSIMSQASLYKSLVMSSNEN